MSYTKKEWINTVYDDEGNILRKGTPLMAEDMNNIEQGIIDIESELVDVRNNAETGITDINNSRGQPLGIATLNSEGIVPSSQLPSVIKEMRIVGTVSERDMLEKFESLRVFVIDASADPTVDSGGAEYLYDGTKFVKVGEQESLDLVLSWGNLTGKPTTFTPAEHRHTESQIDDLDKYTKAQVDTKLGDKSDTDHSHTEFHTHSNKTVVDKLTQTHLDDIHEHSNKVALDKVSYTGDKSTVDLIKLDELENHTHAYGNITGLPTIPTKTGQLENNSNFIQGNMVKVTVAPEGSPPASPALYDLWIVI